MSSMMVPWLHIAGGDTLFFNGIAPSSKGAITGAAIFLFFLSVLDRFVSASRGVMEVHWKKRYAFIFPSSTHYFSATEYSRLSTIPLDQGNDEHDSLVKENAGKLYARRSIPPFTPSIDVSRGVFQATQALLHYALMLAVMYVGSEVRYD